MVEVPPGIATVFESQSWRDFVNSEDKSGRVIGFTSDDPQTND